MLYAKECLFAMFNTTHACNQSELFALNPLPYTELKISVTIS